MTPHFARVIMLTLLFRICNPEPLSPGLQPVKMQVRIADYKSADMA
jgi:hypothetical protein